MGDERRRADLPAPQADDRHETMAVADRSSFRRPCPSRRGFLGGALALGSLAMLAACRRTLPDGAPAGSQGSAARDSSKITCAIMRPACIDPYDIHDAAGAQVAYLLFDTLLTYDFEARALVGLAATSFEGSQDATTFTFHLREASFHNGEPVRAIDFKRAWERIADPSSAAAQANGASEIAYHLSLVEGYGALRAGDTDELSGLSCPDHETLIVRLSAPYADWPYIAAHPALGPVPEIAERDASGFFGAPIGNGPYRIAGTWTADAASIELVRFAAHAPSPAGIPEVSLVIQTDADSAFRAFQIGTLDLCDCPIAQTEKMKGERGMSADGCTMSEGEHFLIGSELSVYFLSCNISAEPFGDADFRRAVSLAIDREALCKTVFKSTRMPADDIVPPHVKGYQRAAWPYSKHDPDAATELLDAIHPKDKKGSRGIKLELSYNPDGGHKKVMEAIIGDLAAVGIECKAETAAVDVLLDRYQNRHYELARMDWTADYPTMDSVLFPLFHSSSAASSNRSGYANADVDAMLADARSTADEPARILKLQQADALIGRDCPVIPLMYVTHVVVGSDRIASLYLDPQHRAHLGTAELSSK